MAGRRVLVLLGALAVTAAVVATPAAAAEKPKLPVPYGFLAAVTNSLLAPDADPPGSNDWSCRPSREHPKPVVLTHGILSSKTTGWQTVSPLLSNNGYCVYALTYGVPTPNILGQKIIGGLLPMEESARELDAFVARVLRSTGAAKIDLVGHSEGTVMPEYWLQFLGGAAKTDKFVAVAPAFKGTLGAPLPVGELLSALGLREPLAAVVDVLCGACTQLVVGSPHLKRLNAQPGGAAVPGVTYTTVLTRFDEIVSPYTSGRLDAPNATNIVVQDGCDIDLSDHLAIIATERTGQIILNALDPAHASPPPCRLSLPALGNQLLPPLL